MIKITNFIIGALLISCFLGIFTLFMSDVQNETGISESNNFSSFNKLSQLNNNITNMKQDIEDIKENPSWIDKIGGYFSAAKSAVSTTTKSIDIMNDITNDGIDELNLGRSGNYLKITIGLILIVLIFIGIILSILVKREL
jgi:hypothetical protein